MSENDIRHHRVQSNDVVLHVETRGSGRPVVALGGTASAAMSTIEFADAIVASDRLLITYDRRGTYRSTDPISPPTDTSDAARRQAADLIAIVDHLRIDRTAVLATCAGSGIALEALCSYPDRVTSVVIHEPMTVSVLPDPQTEISALMRYHDTATTGGGGAGIRAFLTDLGLPCPDDFVEAAEREAARGGILRELVESVLYEPRLADLVEHRHRIAIAVGRVGEADGNVFARAALALADHLRLDVTRVPGHHSAYFFQAAPFAEATLAALESLEMRS